MSFVIGLIGAAVICWFLFRPKEGHVVIKGIEDALQLVLFLLFLSGVCTVLLETAKSELYAWFD